MRGKVFYLFLVPFFVSVLCKVNQDTVDNNIVVTQVERKIDIASHLVKTYTSITIENKGSSTVRSVLFVVDPALKGKLSFIGAVTKDNKDDKLTVVPTTVKDHSDKEIYRVQLRSGLDAGKTVTVEVDAVYAHALTPYPAQITQAEKQYVVYEGNLYLYSPYKTLSQKTTVTAASTSLESYTKTKPVSVSENIITYGPFDEKAPFTEAPLRVHEENNSPFLTVSYLERLLEVSHWGNVAIEEHVDVTHTGATLKGPFSRFDYQRSQDGVSSIKSFKTSLPAAARDVYYRDEIGNISTSHMRELDDAVDIELRPRFPLFGGWKTRYFLGYNVPSYEYLFNKGDNYALKIRFVDHVYDDMVIDEAVVRVILPEGAKNIEVRTPYAVKREEDELHYTYLDTTGRPVIVLRKENLVESHIQEFECLPYMNVRPKKKIGVVTVTRPTLFLGANPITFYYICQHTKKFKTRKQVQKTQRKRSGRHTDDARKITPSTKKAQQTLAMTKMAASSSVASATRLVALLVGLIYIH
ncbi:dolichyl-diphosphooligosaccharide--protein glycosyltransferase subunit 1-like isoform X2 [Littorina saxatilis]|uniref:dolichyl-diphosphooligosaccharide--protein glycosyltransferase subunit 1-like isoform X2 n=1 Tax=Littorina saxatilis TaxID=31220 RepID=UPI0038B48D63